MDTVQKKYHYIVSKIMIISLVLPASAPVYYLLTKANLPVEEFLKVLIYALIAMICVGVVSFYLHRKANQVVEIKDEELSSKVGYYENFLEKGHRLPRAFFSKEERDKDNKESKMVWKLILFPFPLMAYSPIILLLVTENLPFAYFMAYLSLSFMGSIIFGFYIFQKYKKVAQLYEDKKEEIYKNNLNDMDVLLIDKEERKNALRMWREAREDSLIINVIERGGFEESIKKTKLYQEFYKFWSDDTEEEQKLNVKMAIQFYLLLDWIKI